jgi:hypothetical protein
VRSTTFLFTTWCTLVAKFRDNLSQTLLDRHEKADRDAACSPACPRRAPPPRRPGQPAPSRGRVFPRLGALRGTLKSSPATCCISPHRSAALPWTRRSVLRSLPCASAPTEAGRRTAVLSRALTSARGQGVACYKSGRYWPVLMCTSSSSCLARRHRCTLPPVDPAATGISCPFLPALLEHTVPPNSLSRPGTRRSKGSSGWRRPSPLQAITGAAPTRLPPQNRRVVSP